MPLSFYLQGKCTRGVKKVKLFSCHQTIVLYKMSKCKVQYCFLVTLFFFDIGLLSFMLPLVCPQYDAVPNKASGSQCSLKTWKQNAGQAKVLCVYYQVMIYNTSVRATQQQNENTPGNLFYVGKLFFLFNSLYTLLLKLKIWKFTYTACTVSNFC